MLSQFTANLLKRLVSAGPVEATAIGNVMSQLIAMKEISDLQEAREAVKRSFDEYLPQNASATWISSKRRWMTLSHTTQHT